MVGCAPSMQSLLHERHYAEALCAGEVAYFDDDDEDPQARVAAAIVEDMAPSFHMHAVTRAELAAMLGPEVGDKVDDAYLLVRLLADTNQVPLRSFSLAAAFTPVDEEGPLALNHQRMAELTGETLPSPRTVDPSKLDEAHHSVTSCAPRRPFRHCCDNGHTHFGDVLESVATRAGAAGAASSHLSHPTAKDHACQAAPTPTTLDEALASDAHCKPGRRCTRWLMLPRASNQRDIRAMTLHFSFEGGSIDKTCTSEHAAVVPIDGQGALRERIAAMFSDNRLRTLPSDASGRQ